ncbi:MAG: type III pantothenate kinase [Acidiferrobacterales bacterium]
MKVLFDFGNSRLKWAISDNGIQQSGLLADYDLTNLSDELDNALGEFETPQETWISSVAGEKATGELHDWLRKRWSLEGHLIKAETEAYGVVNSYTHPAQLGSDRWAALIAVRHRYTQPATIIDCGTAVTVDLINDNRFYGGVILPGIQLARECLVANTAQLQFKGEVDISSLAKTTSEGIQSGTLLGLVGAINYIVQCQQRDEGLSSKVYLTGGNASLVRPYLDREVEVVDDLVLQGIEVIAELEA